MDWHAGDIVACYGTDLISRVITARTSWPIDPWSCWDAPSHVAIVHADPHHGCVFVESTTLCVTPCLVCGVCHSGVQVQRPEDRLEHYTVAGGRVDVYRLAGINRLSAWERSRLSDFLGEMISVGGDYDKLGALISGSWSSGIFRVTNTDVRTVFCSELIAFVLMALGRMNRENPMRYSPGRLLRVLRRTGVYELIPSHLPQGVTKFVDGPQLRIHDAS